jgi:hypothetical protein
MYLEVWVTEWMCLKSKIRLTSDHKHISVAGSGVPNEATFWDLGAKVAEHTASWLKSYPAEAAGLIQEVHNGFCETFGVSKT